MVNDIGEGEVSGEAVGSCERGLKWITAVSDLGFRYGVGELGVGCGWVGGRGGWLCLFVWCRRCLLACVYYGFIYRYVRRVYGKVRSNL